MKHLLVSLFLIVLMGCTATIRTDPAQPFIDQGRKAPSDRKITIPGLGPCADDSDPSLHLNSQEPVIVLVHGCLGSAGRFRALADLFAFSGQQAVCFSYNDRDSLMVSSAQLIASLEILAGQLQSKNIAVIGHSQGGLIARKALVADRPGTLQDIEANFELVTVSSPFSGIEAANHCSSTLTKILSLGLTIPICKLISGDKWHEITGSSEFIRNPGNLIPQVGNYLKINTDESGSCRRVNVHGNCVEDDYVFSLSEQHYPPVDEGAVVKNIDVTAGHVEIVGDRSVAPTKLVAILQQHGVMRTTPPEQFSAFGLMLTRLY